jgi:iron complex outermembrane receptor protein
MHHSRKTPPVSAARWRSIARVVSVSLALTAASPPALAQDPTTGDEGEIDLAELSLEELLDLEITVASRHKEKLRNAPAAVYVLTGDEIRRSGHTSVQEALRMVPGFHVAQWKTFGWDVTSRGFTGSLSALNESFANQLLLMVDGVSYYSPVLAGIWWPLVDIPLADIERIEIIRGPAGTLWGANAVNGVVHVITKSSKDTQGNLVTGVVNEWEWSGDYRHGGRLGENGTYRTWVSYSSYDPLPASTGARFEENWQIGSIGARADWDLGETRYRLIGTAYTSEFGEELWDAQAMTYAPWDDTVKNGGYLAGSWESGEEGDLHRVQAWVQSDFQKQFDFRHDVWSLDLEYTRTKRLGQSHEVNCGLGYRRVDSDLDGNNGYIDFAPESRQLDTVRAFLQDQIGLPSLDSKLIVGAQVESSTLGDFQLQPNVRWLWNPTADQTVWAAVSRAVRTPSLEEVDIEQRLDNTGPPFLRGTDDFESEELVAYELGYRRPLGQCAFLDLATFFNDFDSLQSVEVDGAGIQFYDNQVEAEAYGVEVALDVDVSPRWRLRSAYSWFEMDFEADAGSAEVPTVDTKDGLIPKNRVNLRSYYDLGEDWELDAGIYWTDEHSSSFFDNPSYWRVDARLGWKPTENLELSVGVQNAQTEEHPEAGEDIFWYGSLVERLYYVSMRFSL